MVTESTTSHLETLTKHEWKLVSMNLDFLDLFCLTYSKDMKSQEKFPHFCVLWIWTFRNQLTNPWHASFLDLDHYSGDLIHYIVSRQCSYPWFTSTLILWGKSVLDIIHSAPRGRASRVSWLELHNTHCSDHQGQITASDVWCWHFTIQFSLGKSYIYISCFSHRYHLKAVDTQESDTESRNGMIITGQKKV